jgi:hypothetical protein
MAVQTLACKYGVGQHTGLYCPRCASKDKAMSLYVAKDGRSMKAYCHRASCGFTYTSGQVEILAQERIRESRSRPFTGPLDPLGNEDIAFLVDRFKLQDRHSFGIKKSEGRYMLPIYSPTYEVRGWISRRPWEGSPLIGGDQSMPKALTYMENEEPVQSWYYATRRSINDDVVVAVEDQISAMRVAQNAQLKSVAILGTGLNDEKVAEVQRHARHLLISLDPDATGQAFAMARKYGMAFDSCRVVILPKDIKDCDVQTVQNLFSI